jgi:hypothetical protein
LRLFVPLQTSTGASVVVVVGTTFLLRIGLLLSMADTSPNNATATTRAMMNLMFC